MQRVFLVLLSLASVVWAQNRIGNGDFAAGQAPWNWHQEKEAKATGGIDPAGGPDGSPALRVQVTAAQGANHVQLTCPFPANEIETGQLYEARFQIRAVPARAVSVHLLGAAKPWTNCGLRSSFEATTEWRVQSVRFRGKRPDQDQAKLDFFLGDAVGEVWLDNVSLIPVDRTQGTRTPVAYTMLSGRARLGLGADGAIAALTDSTTKAVLAGGVDPAPAFRLRLEKPGDSPFTRASTDAAKTEISQDGKAFVGTYTFADLVVTTRVAPNGDGLFTCGIEIENHSPWAITAITYPILHCPDKLGQDSTDDRILYPRCDGGVVEDPLRTMGGQSLDDTYPGPLSCQVMAYYDAQAGLYLATHDGSGSPKRLLARLNLDCELAIEHLLPITPGANVKLAYPTVFGVFSGDWYAAAEIYRQWAHQQVWCATPLSQRPDTPIWLKHGGIVTCYSPRARNKDGEFRFSDAGLREFCDSFLNDSLR